MMQVQVPVMVWLIGLCLGVICLMVLVLVAVRWLSSLRSDLKRSEPTQTCHRCGYPMQRLDVPRCPECGAAYGFKQTFADLGVDEQAVIDYRRQRNESNQTASANEPDA